MNNLQVLDNTKEAVSTMEVLADIKKVKDALLDPKDIVMIKGKKYINKRGFRKLAIAFNISTKVVNEVRIVNDEITIYDFTVRAITPMGRYTEASASCSSIERDFNHLDNDVRATSQTRATNRAISDLIGLAEVSFEEVTTGTTSEYNSSKDNTIATTDDNITQRQKVLLIKLVESKYADEEARNTYYKRIDAFTKSEASETIKGMLNEGARV